MKKDELRAVLQTSRARDEKRAYLVERCRGKAVLDVGCVDNTWVREAGDPNWLHGMLADVAGRIVGADLNEPGIERLKELGYDVRRPSELDGERFDVVVMGDVIEHVDGPVPFLEFYRGFLREGGAMYVTTPNPFSLLQTYAILRKNEVWVNDEHTVWFDPVTLAECAQRAGLEVRSFTWLSSAMSQPSMRERVMLRAQSWLSGVRPYLSSDFAVELVPAAHW